MLIIEEIKIKLLISKVFVTHQYHLTIILLGNNLTSKLSIILHSIYMYHPGEGKVERHGAVAMCSNRSLQSKAFVEDQQCIS